MQFMSETSNILHDFARNQKGLATTLASTQRESRDVNERLSYYERHNDSLGFTYRRLQRARAEGAAMIIPHLPLHLQELTNGTVIVEDESGRHVKSAAPPETPGPAPRHDHGGGAASADSVPEGEGPDATGPVRREHVRGPDTDGEPS
jgi:hypothetical protein